MVVTWEDGTVQGVLCLALLVYGCSYMFRLFAVLVLVGILVVIVSFVCLSLLRYT